ncbi:hypothetical protein C7N43_38950 [Sphingobacteriales bacterium UPWRP_1]|nr:hypothetical protein C7N43_38950 [Sphingobacteriales bacterium UPWRP_1]
MANSPPVARQSPKPALVNWAITSSTVGGDGWAKTPFCLKETAAKVMNAHRNNLFKLFILISLAG